MGLFSSLQKAYYFVDANKNLSFSLLSAVFPYEIRLQRTPKFDIAAAIFDRTHPPGHTLVTSFGSHRLWLLFNCIISAKRALKHENDSSEYSQVTNRLEKNHFAADLDRYARSVASFSASRQFRVGRNDVI